MSISAATFMAEKTGPCAVLELRFRTVLVSVHASLAPASEADEQSTSEPYLLWALTLPMHAVSFADGVYTKTCPVPLGFATAAGQRGVLVTLPRWDVSGGTRTALLLARRDAPGEAIRATLEAALRARRTAAETAQLGVCAGVTRWALSGTEVPLPDLVAEAEWLPLLHHRWYELKSYVREGTVVPYFGERAWRRHESGPAAASAREAASASGPMYAGDVREADAVSINKACVMWTDGTVGLLDELKPFYRVYVPARAAKTIRVRRFPHRYADVVGEIPFGQRVEACGRATDPFTGEQYVLVYLPAGDAFAPHVTTYELTYVEEGRHVWGWSKLAGTSGLPLLAEVDAPEAAPGDEVAAAAVVTGGRAGARAESMTLPAPTFYTPVRDDRAVRIRAKPSLTSSVVREMEANEVRAATALVTVPQRGAADTGAPAAAHVFVEWQQGGYSLLRNATESFLAPVQLSRVPRRFPIRTRSGPADDAATAAAPEVIDLSERRGHKRSRGAAGAADNAEDEDARLAELMRPQRAVPRVATDASLLSPHSLPTSLQEALRQGVVRLEDLPPIGDDSGSDAAGSTDGSDSSSL